MNQKGFSQAILLMIVGIGILVFALYSYIPFFQKASDPLKTSPATTSVALPENSQPTLTEKQQLMIKHKTEIKSKLDLTDEQFDGLVKMASDPEFDY